MTRLLCVLAMLLALNGCGLFDDTPAVTAQDLNQRLNGNDRPVLLDVRTSREFSSGHIPGAVNIDIRGLTKRLYQLDSYKHNPVVIYCETGARARHAVHLLRDAGFTDIALLDGDMSHWRRNRLPTVRGRGAPVLPNPAPAPVRAAGPAVTVAAPAATG